MKLRQRFSRDDLVGVHFALNVFISTTLLWIILHLYARLNPIWAISSMIAASDPDVKQAVKTFRGPSPTPRWVVPSGCYSLLSAAAAIGNFRLRWL